MGSIIAPKTEAELSDAVKMANDNGLKMKVVGMGHSWSPIHHPDTGGIQISLSSMNKMVLDKENGVVNVQSGVVFKDLHEFLAKEGLALAWMSGGIQTLTIGGAISVGYHGSQINVGTISSLTSGMRVLLANGTIVDLGDEHNEELRAIRTGLGLSAIIISVNLPITEQFYLTRKRWEVPTMEEFQALHLPQWRDHPRFHWYWHPYTDKVWLMTWENATKADFERENLPCRTAVDQYEDALLTEFGDDGFPLVMRWDNCTDISYLAYTHADDMRAQPIWNKEYFVPAVNELEVLADFVKSVRESPNPISRDFWVHERYLTSDDSFLMPCYGMGQCSSFEVAQVATTMAGPLPTFDLWRSQTEVYDQVMQRHQGRPHWAKENLVDYEYLKKSGLPLDEFNAVREQLDPKGTFMNSYLKSKILPADGSACVDTCNADAREAQPKAIL